MIESISLAPIGYVKNQFTENTPADQIRPQPVQLIIKPELVAGLMGLQAGQNILVLFYFHQAVPEGFALQLHPRHDPANPLQGVFATRSPYRPVNIGATVAQIESIEGHVLTVTGLDALNETPILDIKPYIANFDTAPQFAVRQVADIAEARHKIDELDAEIIRLFGHRAKYVHQVAEFKKDVTEVRAPARYEQVMQSRRQMAVTAGLNPDVIEQMYKLLVENFIKEEEKIVRDRIGI